MNAKTYIQRYFHFTLSHPCATSPGLGVAVCGQMREYFYVTDRTTAPFARLIIGCRLQNRSGAENGVKNSGVKNSGVKYSDVK